MLIAVSIGVLLLLAAMVHLPPCLNSHRNLVLVINDFFILTLKIQVNCKIWMIYV